MKCFDILLEYDVDLLHEANGKDNLHFKSHVICVVFKNIKSNHCRGVIGA